MRRYHRYHRYLPLSTVSHPPLYPPVNTGNAVTVAGKGDPSGAADLPERSSMARQLDLPSNDGRIIPLLGRPARWRGRNETDGFIGDLLDRDADLDEPAPVWRRT
jgi:hypothetical protein